MENINNIEEAAPQGKKQHGKWDIYWLAICIFTSLPVIFSNIDILDKGIGLAIVWATYVFIKLLIKYKKSKTFWLVLLAIFGLCLSVELAIIYYNVNFLSTEKASFCVLNETVNCDAVAKTQFSEFLGIPLALYGVFLYTFMIFMCFVDKLQNFKYLSILKVFKNKYSYIFSIYCLSFAISMLLTFVQFKLIHKFCILCFITYLVDLVSLFVAKDYKQSLFYEIKTTVKDFVDAIKVKSNLIAFIAVLFAAAGVLYFTWSSSILTPQKINYFYKMKGNPYKVYGNNLGNPDGDVVIYEYSDFACPWCKVLNRMLQKATTEFDNIYVIHYNFPLDTECNPALKNQIHPGSCKMAKFAIAAKKQEKYWEMVNTLFDKNPKTGRDLYRMVEKIGIDPTQLANDYLKEETQKELDYEILTGLHRKIDATPTIFIGNEKYTGFKSYDDLKEVLVKHGANKKSK